MVSKSWPTRPNPTTMVTVRIQMVMTMKVRVVALLIAFAIGWHSQDATAVGAGIAARELADLKANRDVFIQATTKEIDVVPGKRGTFCP